MKIKFIKGDFVWSPAGEKQGSVYEDSGSPYLLSCSEDTIVDFTDQGIYEAILAETSSDRIRRGLSGNVETPE